MDREAWHAAVMGSQRIGHNWATELNRTESHLGGNLARKGQKSSLFCGGLPLAAAAWGGQRGCICQVRQTHSRRKVPRKAAVVQSAVPTSNSSEGCWYWNFIYHTSLFSWRQIKSKDSFNSKVSSSQSLRQEPWLQIHAALRCSSHKSTTRLWICQLASLILKTQPHPSALMHCQASLVFVMQNVTLHPSLTVTQCPCVSLGWRYKWDHTDINSQLRQLVRPESLTALLTPLCQAQLFLGTPRGGLIRAC